MNSRVRLQRTPVNWLPLKQGNYYKVSWCFRQLSVSACLDGMQIKSFLSDWLLLHKHGVSGGVQRNLVSHLIQNGLTSLLSFYIVNLLFCVNFVSILCSVNEVKKRTKDKVCVYLCKGKRQVSAVHKRRERSARPQLPFDDVESLFKKPCEGGIPVHGLSFRHGKCYLCKSKSAS